MTERSLLWADGQLVEGLTDDPGQLAVADSFLVQDGRVLGLELHRNRFSAAAARASLGRGAELEPFWDSCVAELPLIGDWFPRVELWSEGSLRLRLRHAPPMSRAPLRVRVHHGEDPRSNPGTKGPDLKALADVRAWAAADGLNEVLLLDDDGHVCESTTAALLWWNGSRLFVPASDLPWLPSVTGALIRRMAQERGVTVEPVRATPGDLLGGEVWLANALHGIRAIAQIDDVGQLAEGGRADAWHGALRAQAQAI